MIVGFSKHGTGNGYGPVNYLTNKELEGREQEPPVIVRGDPEHTKNLIDSLDFKHKYTSGVLSFAHGEKITPEMENEIIERFENVAFAGLEPDRYNILWVRHTHAGHHELHFLTPRIELETKKSLNIRPPGKVAKATFDDFRSEINARYGLADPDDPDRARNIAIPDHELKKAAEALRKGEKAPDNVRQLIDDVLTERAVNGLITSRNDVLEHVKDLGFEVTRQGKDYITVKEPESGQRWRLKGALYDREFEPSTTIERAEKKRERDYSKPDAAAAERYKERVNQHIKKRTEYNQKRYKRPDKEHGLEHVKKSDLMADFDGDKSLHGHLSRELGNDAILYEQSNTTDPEHQSSKREPRPFREQEQWSSNNEMHGQTRPEPDLWQDSPELQGEILGRRRNRIRDIGEQVNDRTRKSLIERFRAFGTRIQDATNRIIESTRKLTNNVRAYFQGERELTQASKELEQSSTQLERADTTLSQIIHDRQLEKSKSYDFDMEM